MRIITLGRKENVTLCNYWYIKIIKLWDSRKLSEAEPPSIIKSFPTKSLKNIRCMWSYFPLRFIRVKSPEITWSLNQGYQCERNKIAAWDFQNIK